MTKINKKEYEILKGLDDKWKWIARDKNRCLYAFTGKPVKKYGPLLYWGTEGFLSFELFDEKHLFQFIQWEDEEPHNIQELIKEYEYHNEPVKLAGGLSITQAKYDKYLEEHIKELENESEETEVKRDIEWLNNEIEKIIKDVENDDVSFAGKEDYDEGYIDGIRDTQSIVNQLDEPEAPEVLTQEFIESNSVYASSDGVTEEYVHVDDLQNLIVPKQESPVVPTWFDEWWKNATKGGGNLFHNIERFYDELFSSGTRETYEYISSPDNKKKLLNIIINELDYEVEKEQKYIVSDNSSIPLLIKNDSGEVMSYDSQIAYNSSNGTIELTEQEIKDYDERYMAFAKPVVVCN